MTNRFLAFDLGGRERSCHPGAAPSRGPDDHRVVSLSERAGTVPRRAPLGRLAALAGDAARARSADGARARQPRRRHLGLRLRSSRRAREPARESLQLPRRADRRRDAGGQRSRRRPGRLRRDRHAVPPFNTLYQLYAACRSTPRLIAAAQALATIPDLLNFWLSGRCNPSTRTRRRRHGGFAYPELGAGLLDGSICRPAAPADHRAGHE